MTNTYTLQNAHLRVTVAALGAELQSIYSYKTDTEYLWQPGNETWPHHSLLLFPNPGRIAHSRTIIGGKVYPAKMHGFASEMPFDVLEHTEEKLVMQLSDNDVTRKFFPYAFRLIVEFILQGDTLVQNFRVVNDDHKTVYYSLGAHPGFYCPIELNEPAGNYKLSFDRPQDLKLLQMEENTRLLTGKEIPYLSQETDIPLGDKFFDNGPMIFGNMDANTITLHSPVSGRFVEFGIAGFPYLCLWGVPSKMSIIAIEPWCGVSDRTDTNHVWEEKPGICRVEVGQEARHTLTFRVG